MTFKFTIDKLFNKYLPRNQTKCLPNYIGRFLGNNNNDPTKTPDYWIWLEIMIGSFCGILLIEGVFRNHTAFTSHNTPIIIASYGASAILCFNANGVPLAQPRNVLLGQFVASLLGVCIEKLFLLSENGRNHYYIGGALSVGVSSVVMLILNCVHPPAGASALLPFVDDSIRSMSWWYLPVQLVSSVLMIVVALITGNVMRKYPIYWWYPTPPLAPKPALVVTKDEVKFPKEVDLDENEIQLLYQIQYKFQEKVV